MKKAVSAVLVSGLLALGAACAGSGQPTGTAATSGHPSSSSSSGVSVGGGTSNVGGGDGSGGAVNVGGGTTSSVGAGGATACPSLGDACTDCLAHQCSVPYCACYNDATCGSLVQCIQGCAPNNAACNQTCETNNEAGVSQAELVNDCAAMQCASACPGTAVLSACERCAFQQCPMQSNKCAANPACAALVTCVEGCNGDSLCIDGCAINHSGGQTDAQNLQNCTNNACGNACM